MSELGLSMATHFRVSRIMALVVATLSIGIVVGYLAFPIIGLFLRSSPELFFSSLTEPKVIDALVLSLTTSAVAMAIIVGIGTPAAYFHSKLCGCPDLAIYPSME